MSYGIVKSIMVDEEQGRVIVSCSSNNVWPRDYTPAEITSLSKVYREGGQHVLDMEIVDMFLGYATPSGPDRSLQPYRCVLQSKQAAEVFARYGIKQEAGWGNGWGPAVWNMDREEYRRLLSDLADVCEASRKRQAKRRRKATARDIFAAFEKQQAC